MNYILGVDRSHNNEPVPLVALHKKGARFIMFKATQGLTYVDPTFDKSWKEVIKTLDLKRGAYHFFDGRFDGSAQAKHYLAQGINFNAKGCFAPIVDIEDLVGSDKADTTALNKWIKKNRQLVLKRFGDFLHTIKIDTGKDCIIYSYNSYMRDTLRAPAYPNNPFWLSSLQANCPTRYDNKLFPTFWQFTYNWNKTDMDGNYFAGTETQFNTLTNIK